MRGGGGHFINFEFEGKFNSFISRWVGVWISYFFFFFFFFYGEFAQHWQQALKQNVDTTINNNLNIQQTRLSCQGHGHAMPLTGDRCKIAMVCYYKSYFLKGLFSPVVSILSIKSGTLVNVREFEISLGGVTIQDF